MRDRRYLRLAILYGVYFLALGASSYTSVFLSGKNMDNAQIGMLMSIPTIASLVVQPFWGLAGDRAKYKRNVLAIAYAGTGIACFVLDSMHGFGALVLAMILYSFFSQACSPLVQTICMEYTEGKKGGFGPIRMVGSIAYQVVVLALGFLLSGSMPQLFRVMGVIYVFCGAYSLAAPPVRGHQHQNEKLSPLLLLRDRRIVLLMCMTFCGMCVNTFYVSFYNKHMQELFQSNMIMSLLFYSALVLEIPFLLFSDRFMKKMKISYWVLVGFAVNAIRFVGVSLTDSIPVLVLLQLPAFTIMGCFQFYPTLYMNAVVPKELRGSVQSLNVVITSCLTQLAGSLVGGYLADAIGLQRAFGVYGGFLIFAFIVFMIPAGKVDMSWPQEESSAISTNA